MQNAVILRHFASLYLFGYSGPHCQDKKHKKFKLNCISDYN